MEVWATVDDVRLPLASVPALARRAEALGFDGLVVPEAVDDGVLAALLALEHTERLRVATGVVVAFARSPMLLAQDAFGLARLSGGRFALGLGSQVRGNVERRFGMPWSAPAPRMRDYVGALRAVFARWQHGTPLRFESAHYRLDRMQPFFAPAPLEHGAPPIWLGAVGPAMTRVAGEVADRLLTHPTNADPRTLAEVTRPALDEGARRAGRAPGATGVIASPLTATGPDDAAVAAERERIRELLAFLYTTPAYHGALRLHGQAHVGEALHERSRRGEWSGLRELVSDALLDTLVPAAPFDRIADVLRDRYAHLADGLTLRLPPDPTHDPAFSRALADLRTA